MLSQRTKARIKRNKARRIQCRTKDGRDLYKLVKTTMRRTANAAVDYLLKMTQEYQKYSVPTIDGHRQLLFPVSVDDDSTNPNTCLTCDHTQNPEGGHCYMFKDAPTEVCMQHTGRKQLGISRFL